MDSKLILVYSIILLWKESTLNDQKGSSNDFVREVIDSIQIPEISIDSSDLKSILTSLRATVYWMLDQPVEHEYVIENLKKRIKLNIPNDPSLCKMIDDALVPDEDQYKVKSECSDILSQFRDYKSQVELVGIIKKTYQDVVISPKGNLRKTIADIIADLEPYAKASNDILNDESHVGDVDTDDPDKLAEVFATAMEMSSSKGVMHTGWQGVNRMLGPHQGLKRGENVLVSALPHNYKSGFMGGVTRQVCMYNTPYLIDPKKRPLNILLSLENELEEDVRLMYQMAYENTTGKPFDINELDPAEAAEKMKLITSAMGYKLVFLRKDPTSLTYRDICDIIDYYESKGYEIHLFTVDYLNMISKDGCTGANQAERIIELFRRIRNYTAPRKITFLTAHQLSNDAMKVKRLDSLNFVKEIVNKNYYADSGGISREVDLEISIHIELAADGAKYLTMARGKHRSVVTPEADLYTCYRFEPIAAIPDDFGKADKSRKAPGGATADGSDSGEWWA